MDFGWVASVKMNSSFLCESGFSKPTGISLDSSDSHFGACERTKHSQHLQVEVFSVCKWFQTKMTKRSEVLKCGVCFIQGALIVRGWVGRWIIHGQEANWLGNVPWLCCWPLSTESPTCEWEVIGALLSSEEEAVSARGGAVAGERRVGWRVGLAYLEGELKRDSLIRGDTRTELSC